MFLIKKYFYDIIIILLIFNMSGASVFAQRYLPTFLGILLFFIHTIKKRKYNIAFIKILIIWLLINILAIVLKTPFSLFRLFNNTIILFFLPYYILSKLGIEFWIKFEKYIFFLTLLSIPLYILNNIYNGYFNSLGSIFTSFTNPGFTVNRNYWSAIIYVNSFAKGSFGLMRNCGFMWEPGAFAMMLVWAIVYNWIVGGIKFDRRIIVYILALLTTFSTAGYFALLVILSTFFLRKITVMNITLVVATIILFGGYVYQLEFMSTKIDTYVYQFQGDITGETGHSEQKVNRLQGGVTALMRTLKYPLGYGLLSYNDMEDQNFSYGTNGLGSLLEMWGILGFIYLLVLIKKWFGLLLDSMTNVISVNLMFFALMIMFFSNPIARFLLVYFIILTPLSIKSPILMVKNFMEPPK